MSDPHAPLAASQPSRKRTIVVGGAITVIVVLLVISYLLSVPQAGNDKANAGLPAVAKNEPVAGQSVDDQIKVIKANAEAELAKAKSAAETKAADEERQERIAAAKANRDLAIAKAQAEVELEKLHISSQKEVAVAEMKANAEAAKASRVERLEALKAAERAKAPTASEPPQMVPPWGYGPPQMAPVLNRVVASAPPGYVLLDGRLVRKDELTNPVHCTEESCGGPEAPTPLAPQQCNCEDNDSFNLLNGLQFVFAPSLQSSGGRYQRDSHRLRPIPRAHYPERRQPPRARYCPPPPRPQPRPCPPRRR